MERNTDHNVEVLNGTVDFTAILTQQNKEFLYDCVEDTLDRVILMR
jgi:hypothetical protein